MDNDLLKQSIISAKEQLQEHIKAEVKKAKIDAVIETCDKILGELDIEMKCGYCDIFDTIEDKVIEIKQAQESEVKDNG